MEKILENIQIAIESGPKKAELARIESLMPEWLPIETAPKDGTEIDVWVKNGFRIINVRWKVDGGYWVYNRDYINWNWLGALPTHWLPIPKPPENRDG